jgi:hypothetical protein
MKEAARSAWQAVFGGRKRAFAMVGALFVLVPIGLFIAGHRPAIWWLLAALAFVLISVLSGYHDLRIERDRLVAEAEAVDDRWEHLEAQMRKVDSVRTWLMLQEHPDEKMRLAQDEVFLWAKATYELLLSKFPAESDRFMDEDDAELGSPYFATSYSYYVYRTPHGRQGFLESRADLLRSMLREQ